MDFSIINGGSAASGDVIQYFVVAQDDADNYVSSVPGVEATTPNPVQNITAAPSLSNVNSYLILSNFNGTYTVPGNYANLTGTNGLFDAINLGEVTGDFTVQITDNLVEPGTVALNEFATPYTMTIVPADASLKTITGNIDDGLIRFDGADHVTIDGRFDGAGQYLEFSNTSTGTNYINSAFLFVNGATYNTLQFISIKSQGASGGIIKSQWHQSLFGSLLIQHHRPLRHYIHDFRWSSDRPYILIPMLEVQIPIIRFPTVIFLALIRMVLALLSGNSDWTISGNSFYQTAMEQSTRSQSMGIYCGYTNGANLLFDW